MVTHCSRCGILLGTDAECPRCLLELGLSHASIPSQPSGLRNAPTPGELQPYFPQLQIQRVIGQGGMGTVYQARQTTLDRNVALKLIHRDASQDPMFLVRFEREAKTLAKLSHPNIVTIYDYGRTSHGMAYLIMEYVEGMNLRQAIEAKSLLPEESVEIMLHLCAAVETAHARGIIHRDIKPENILLDIDGVVKIADFGIAKLFSDGDVAPNLTASRQLLGSPNYLAPEHIEAPHLVDYRIDIYALGVVFYELLTGQLPIGRYESPSALGVAIPPAMEGTLLKALERRPDQRFSSATAMRQAILNAKQGTPSFSERPVSQTPRSFSVPIQHESESGLVHAVGIAHAKQDGLLIEFRFRDPFFGAIKSGTHSVHIPQHQLSKLELKNGPFSSLLSIVADSISVLGNLPDAETGCVRFRVKKSDRELAEGLVQALGFEVKKKAPVPMAAASDHRHFLLGILLLFCGLLNGGVIAIGVLLFVQNLPANEGYKLAIANSLLGILIGPVVFVQWTAGLAQILVRAKGYTLSALVLSMIPLTPVWVLSLPIGIWGWRFLMENEISSVPPSAPRPQWGATTLMYLRESKTARVVSLLNALAIVIGGTFLTIFMTGYYPAEAIFRPLVEGYTLNDLKNSVQGRLDAIKNVQVTHTPGGNLSIRAYRYQLKNVVERLAIAGTVRVVPILSNNAVEQSTGDSPSWFPVTKGLKTNAFASKTQALGESIACDKQSLTLEREFVKKVVVKSPKTIFHERQLLLYLTAEGRKGMEQLALEREGIAAIGLEVDGVIQGYVLRSDFSNVELPFCLSGEDRAGGKEQLNGASLQAAIRGPVLASELELVE